MADLHRKGHPTDKLVEVSRRLRNLEIGTRGRQRKYGEMIVSGAFDITVDYAVGQVVEYEGATYVVSPSAPTPPPAGTLPTDATYWMPVGSQAGALNIVRTREVSACHLYGHRYLSSRRMSLAS